MGDILTDDVTEGPILSSDQQQLLVEMGAALLLDKIQPVNPLDPATILWDLRDLGLLHTAVEECKERTVIVRAWLTPLGRQVGATIVAAARRSPRKEALKEGE